MPPANAAIFPSWTSISCLSQVCQIFRIVTLRALSLVSRIQPDEHGNFPFAFILQCLKRLWSISPARYLLHSQDEFSSVIITPSSDLELSDPNLPSPYVKGSLLEIYHTVAKSYILFQGVINKGWRHTAWESVLDVLKEQLAALSSSAQILHETEPETLISFGSEHVNFYYNIHSAFYRFWAQRYWAEVLGVQLQVASPEHVSRKIESLSNVLEGLGRHDPIMEVAEYFAPVTLRRIMRDCEFIVLLERLGTEYQDQPQVHVKVQMLLDCWRPFIQVQDEEEARDVHV
ncbi:hypothetical protein K439DRAFT_1636562 [Ramaria rubella]|nr:hypothetical protein K439DRAFT_1636562 [Ramaria rubella]